MHKSAGSQPRKKRVCKQTPRNPFARLYENSILFQILPEKGLFGEKPVRP
jgi:hypothetical protein